MTAVDLDGDSATRWFTEVGLVTQEQPIHHSRPVDQPHLHSRHRQSATNLPASSDGSVHKSHMYSHPGEVRYKTSDGQIHRSSQHRSGHVDMTTGQGKYRQQYPHQGRYQRDEGIAVEPSYLPYYQDTSQQQMPPKHNTDYYCERPSIPQCNLRHHHPVILTQSRQQVMAEPDMDRRHSGTAAQAHLQFCGPEDPSRYQPVPHSHKNVAMSAGNYRTGAQPQQLPQYLLLYQDMPQSEQIYRSMPHSQECQDHQNQHIRTDLQYQVRATNLSEHTL